MNWAAEVLPEKMRQIKRHVLGAVRGKLDDRAGIFDFLGLDFMVDTDLNVWLIEVNVNPALHTNCTALAETIPPAISTAIDIVLELFDKQCKGKQLWPMQCDMGDFKLLRSMR